MKRVFALLLVVLFIISMPLSVTASEQPTLGEKNAVDKAITYLDIMSFSKNGLIKQLEYEGFTKSEAKYGVDHIEVDWNEQAVLKAENYLELMSFSKSGLINQLEYEGFTTAEAKYGAQSVGY